MLIPPSWKSRPQLGNRQPRGLVSGDSGLDDAAKRSFGILAAACDEDALCGVYCMGGIYETDQYTGNISAGDELACDADTGKLKAASGDEFVVGETISLVSGVLRFKLLV